MSVVRVTYTVSEDTKEKIDSLKKLYNVNISELVSNLLKFDDNAVSTMFKYYKLINKDTISGFNQLTTNEGSFIWNKELIKKIDKIILNAIDLEKIDQLLLTVVATNEKSKNEIISDMMHKQSEIITATAAMIRRDQDRKVDMLRLEKRIDILEKKLLIDKNN